MKPTCETAKHTPGPWKHNPTWGLIMHGRTEIAALHSGNIANARLIAAAPCMLAALKSIMPFLRDMEDDYREHGVPELLNNAKTAINKALGTP